MFRFLLHFRSWSSCGAILDPRSPKTSPRGVLGPIVEGFDPQLGGFWEDFGAHLGGFWAGLVPTTQQARKQTANQPDIDTTLHPWARGRWPKALIYIYIYIYT